MKKLFAIVAVFVMLFVNAYACEYTLPTESSVPNVYMSYSYWAIDKETQELYGILSPLEAVATYPIQNVDTQYVRGFSSTGLIRVHGRAKFICSDTFTAGLTYLTNVTIKIKTNYATVVDEIVNRRTGYTTCANTIVASTFWAQNDTIAHIFFTKNMNVFSVGTVVFNGGKDSTTLWAGDFDGDGTLELGFMAGVNDVRPTPTPAPTPKPCRRTPTAKKCANKCNSTLLQLCVHLCVQVKTVNCVK